MNQGIWEKIYAKIRWLRTQPENVKVRYVWISALIVFAVVVLLWVELFRKYERKPIDSGNTKELNEAIKKIENDVRDKIKVPDIKFPATPTPSVFPELSPSVSPKVLK